MTTTAPPPTPVGQPTSQPSASSGESRRRPLATVLTTVKHSLDRPLTSYYLLLGASGMLLVIGLLMVLSASSVDGYRNYGTSYYWVLRQLTWVVISVPFVLLAVRMPHRLLRALAWPALGLSVVLLYLTQTSMGVTVNGNKNWLALGPFQIQPAELAKLAVILWCSHIYATKERLLNDWRHTLIPVVPVMATVVGLVVLGRDLGTALVLMAIVLGLLWVIGAPIKIFVGSFLVAAVAALGLAATSEERMERLTSFADPFQSFQGSGWQAAHGIFAMSSGGIFGRGIGASQQKWGDLPAAHTDFIFAVIGEELGLFGSLMVLVMFLVLGYAGIRIALRSDHDFSRYAAAGITAWFLVQALINLGCVLRLLPIAGVPLPLVSYGGSALLANLAGVGVLLACARDEPGARRVRAARAGTRKPRMTAIVGSRSGGRGPDRFRGRG